MPRSQNPEFRKLSDLAIAWLILCAAFVVHVVDEALNHFPETFNHTVEYLRDSFPGVPFWTFTYASWWAAMVVLLTVLLLLLIPVSKGGKTARVLARIFGVVMLLNGIGHIANSLIFGRFLPGVDSSPLLLAASVWLLTASRRPQQQVSL